MIFLICLRSKWHFRATPFGNVSKNVDLRQVSVLNAHMQSPLKIALFSDFRASDVQL